MTEKFDKDIFVKYLFADYTEKESTYNSDMALTPEERSDFVRELSESIDNIGNNPWGTLRIPLGYPWGNHIGNLVNLSIIIDT